jgi:hypothetical protein
MNELLLDRFERETTVEYRNEKYRVRDNGAVCRQPRPERRRRKLDDIWTFGNPNRISGYMDLGSEVVHRIVATAYHGAQPSEKHIVDHIDSNRRNNRPENLRWVTRLDNILLNPITLKKIVFAYGSLDAFFADPSSERGVAASFDWMRTVSKEEADESRRRLLRWAEAGKVPQGGQLGEWLFGRVAIEPLINEEIPDLDSLTPLAVQRNWKTPTEFPLCPASVNEESLEEYVNALNFGTVFARNTFGESRSVIAGTEADILSVIANLGAGAIKEWAVTKIVVVEGRFIHESMGTFFTLQGALKSHCKLLGISTDESIDDYA